MMFVPATPGAELRRTIQEEMDMLEMKVKVVEKPGEKFCVEKGTVWCAKVPRVAAVRKQGQYMEFFVKKKVVGLCIMVNLPEIQ